MGQIGHDRASAEHGIKHADSIVKKSICNTYSGSKLHLISRDAVREASKYKNFSNAYKDSLNSAKSAIDVADYLPAEAVRSCNILESMNYEKIGNSFYKVSERGILVYTYEHLEEILNLTFESQVKIWDISKSDLLKILNNLCLKTSSKEMILAPYTQLLGKVEELPDRNIFFFW